jgi:O-acetyl-ADP-ribose deacetylase (regulator of RNase III)
VKYKKTCNGIAIEVVFGEITDVHADAVVNTANDASFQIGDAGISGALRNLMYPPGIKKEQYDEEDNKVITTMKDVYVDGTMKRSKHVEECAAGMQAAAGVVLQNYKHVIHAVGPRWANDLIPTKLTFSMGRGNLNTTIRNVFHAADGLNIKSIVFCIISGGLFCHDIKTHPKWNAKEKTAARQELVDAIYNHCVTSAKEKTPRLERIVVFEYDNQLSEKDKEEASRLLTETIDMLTNKCGGSAVVEGGEKDEEDAEDDKDAKEGGEEDEEDTKEGREEDEEEAEGGKGGEDVEEEIKELEGEMEEADDAEEDEEDVDEEKKDLEETERGDDETLSYDPLFLKECTNVNPEAEHDVFMPWNEPVNFQAELDMLPKINDNREQTTRRMLHWTQKYAVLDGIVQGQTEKERV